MRMSTALIFPVLASLGCVSGAGSTPSSGGTGGKVTGSGGSGGGGSGSGSGSGGSSSGSGGSGAVVDGGSRDSGTDSRDGMTQADATPPREDAAVPPPDGGSAWLAGNPAGSCSTGIPAKGRPVDTSTPTTVVGTGTAASCTFIDLRAAIGRGGIITFRCGNGPVTILITATLSLPTDKNTVIDGGNQITLDGGNAVQILSFNNPDFQANDNGLTLQHIALVNGKKTPAQSIPTAPKPCSQGWDDGEGGALYMRDGNLVVIDSIFTNNHAAPLGPDTGGGAIYVLGSKNGALIVGSTFSRNSAANAGAVGGLFTDLSIYNSLFTGNMASGNGANYDDATMCSVMNNGQNEVGSGGNGGAVYSDGGSVDVTLCGDAILNNAAGAGAFGGGLFFTSNDMNGILSITDTAMSGNTGGYWTNAASGVTNVGSAIGVNAKSITVVNSTLQGRP